MLRRFLSLLGLVFFISFPVQAQTPIKNYPFKNQNGVAFQLHDIKGNYLFISFVYTRCPVAQMCPLTMTLNKAIFNFWKKTSPAVPLKFLVVTLDPSNDTPTTLKSYGNRFGLDWNSFILATGEEQTISDFSAEFNAIGFPSNGLVSHNSRSILMDPNFIPLKDYKENEWNAESVIKDLLQFESKRQKKS